VGHLLFKCQRHIRLNTGLCIALISGALGLISKSKFIRYYWPYTTHQYEQLSQWYHEKNQLFHTFAFILLHNWWFQQLKIFGHPSEDRPKCCLTSAIARLGQQSRGLQGLYNEDKHTIFFSYIKTPITYTNIFMHTNVIIKYLIKEITLIL
jgi:hypothetical protein